ncbi:MAG: hypothetical protein U9Q81_11385 [Pseudomonadota bacterium]|nr:hypothetical protein [Pseudomonadota bacterium]
MSHADEPRKLPVILSAEEVTRLPESAPELKCMAAPPVAYDAGLGGDRAEGSALAHCRSAALGGHVERCQACGYTQIAYSLQAGFVPASFDGYPCPKCRPPTPAA